ncbi:glycosyltransferase [Ekhidna sp.]|uniref:glycosyltransferase n=1 Tax=Ekhidna sp. TaxID=2608089 RepID=UPI003B508A4C
MNDIDDHSKCCLAVITIEPNEEPFLVQELYYHAKKFDQVYVLPSTLDSEIKTDFKNIHISTILMRNFSDKSHIIRVLKKMPWTVLMIFVFEIMRNPARIKYLIYWKSMLDYLCQDLDKFHDLRNWILTKEEEQLIFYDYWFLNASISLALLKKRKVIKGFVTRAHGFDLYDERHHEATVPFRYFKVMHADSIYCVSKHGQDYLKSKIPKKYHQKIKLSYLGVRVNTEGISLSPADTQPQLVVSCATLLDFKNVHRIPGLLSAIKDRKIRWVHFGDGPLMKTLLDEIKKLDSNVSVELKGNVENHEIIRFYKENYISLFIALSYSEGLPVSIMEAAMFGIPTIAFNVNGVSEIVNDKSGFLLSPDTDWNQIKEHFGSYLQSSSNFDRHQIKNLAEKNFCSEQNHLAFIDSLKNHPNIAKWRN